MSKGFAISDLTAATGAKPAPSQSSHKPTHKRQTTGAVASARRQDPRKDKVPAKGPAAAGGRTKYQF